jgi:dCMP deaminase
MTRPTRDRWGLQLAQVTAKRSTCLRRNVGCVLVNKRGHILATGYNGVSAGAKHCNEEEQFRIRRTLEFDGRKLISQQDTVKPQYPHACSGAQSPSGANLDGCQAIHAEQNALLQCQDVWDIETCYTTTSPCMTCVKLLLNTSCQRIVFSEDYPHSDAKVMWENAGREWVNI